METLLTQILPLCASTDDDTVEDAISIVRVVISDERHQVAFVRLRGLQSLYLVLDTKPGIDQHMVRGIIESWLVSPVLVGDDALREVFDTAREVLAASGSEPRAVT